MIDFSDMGLTERMKPQAVKLLRHCDAIDRWFVWTGKRWRMDDDQARFLVAKAMITALQNDIELIVDDDERKEAFKRLNGRRSIRQLAALLSTLASEEGISTRAPQWDSDPLALMTPDGVVDLKTATIRPATPTDLMHRCTGVAPMTGTPERWIQFIDEITCGRKDLAEYIRRAIGMTLCGVQRDQVLFLCNGIGSNGKSKLIETLVEALGDYACVAMPNLLSARTNDAHPTELMQLEGRRLVYCDEVKDNRLDESKIKRMTGGAQITARGISQDPRTFAVQFSVWADCNEKPMILGTDDGIWRRIRLLPFEAQFRGDKRDPRLTEKLRAELPQILQWSIDAAREYLAEGLYTSIKVDAATKAYRNEQDVMLEFIEQCAIVDADRTCSTAEIYEAVSAYLETIGFKPWSKRRVTQMLTKRGTVARFKGSGGARMLRGITLRTDWRSALGLSPAKDYARSWNE